MTKPKSISAYETSDGEIFKTSLPAYEHQRMLNFNDWYDNHEMPYGDGQFTHPCGGDAHEWLMENRKYLLELLK